MIFPIVGILTGACVWGYNWILVPAEAHFEVKHRREETQTRDK